MSSPKMDVLKVMLDKAKARTAAPAVEDTVTCPFCTGSGKVSSEDAAEYKASDFAKKLPAEETTEGE